MRTTLTIDDDVAILLERIRGERGLPFKEVVNLALRLGLAQLERKQEPRSYRAYTQSVSGGKCLIPLESISQALAIAEGEDYR
ncbi:MAG: DUF2191 domain-containing protein [Candidatus Eremiobacteraeota bacterium]|nr:DUF2191 domain-containing protein [Candidatus Eremiobacteraeota bacterium]MCW5870069.1 DUF2191 domain-containing protein [Candidatus Eremiobacteraeota bacterium]